MDGTTLLGGSNDDGGHWRSPLDYDSLAVHLTAFSLLDLKKQQPKKLDKQNTTYGYWCIVLIIGWLEV